jgi:hypothetical protein
VFVGEDGRGGGGGGEGRRGCKKFWGRGPCARLSKPASSETPGRLEFFFLIYIFCKLHPFGGVGG